MQDNIAIEYSIEENKPNRLFNNILKLKKEKKEKENLLKELFESDNEMQIINDQIKENKKLIKKQKEKLMNQSKFKEIKNDIEDLKAEIKNDTEILKDFALVAVTKNEQLSLFDIETNEKYFPDLSVTLKKF